MRILFRFKKRFPRKVQIKTIENISIDGRCYPLVDGSPPYSSSEWSNSPLAEDTSLWFKSLSVDTVYIDCNEGLIWWSPVAHGTHPSDTGTPLSSLNNSDKTRFVSSNARSLFDDIGMTKKLQMDAKCQRMAAKLVEKKLPAAELKQILATFLHQDVLPYISFLPEDVNTLLVSARLIEERSSQLDIDIGDMVAKIKCAEGLLNSIKLMILRNDDLFKESSIQTCNRDFLRAFVEALTKEVNDVNSELETQQIEIYAYRRLEQKNDGTLLQLQERRDELFKTAERIVRMKEEIQNILSSEQISQRKNEKAQTRAEIPSNSLHDEFMKVFLGLEGDSQALSKLHNDKKNIMEAYKATMLTISKLQNSSSEGELKDLDFHDFIDVWPIMRTRTNKILEDKTSKSSKLHTEGCQTIRKRIEVALLEFSLMNSDKESGIRLQNTGHKRGFHSHLSDSTNHMAWRNLTTSSAEVPTNPSRGGHRISSPTLCLDTGTRSNFSQNAQAHKETSKSLSDVNVVLVENHAVTLFTDNEHGLSKEVTPSISTSRVNETSLTVNENQAMRLSGQECSGNDQRQTMMHSQTLTQRQTMMHSQTVTQRQTMTLQLALSQLVKAVKILIMQIESHLRVVMNALVQEQFEGHNIAQSENDKEIIWKIYEQIFCHETLAHIRNIYKTGLSPGTKALHAKLAETPLQKILDDNKTLAMILAPAKQLETTPVATVLSGLTSDVRHCDIRGLCLSHDRTSIDANAMQNIEVGHEQGGAKRKRGNFVKHGNSEPSRRLTAVEETATEETALTDLRSVVEVADVSFLEEVFSTDVWSAMICLDGEKTCGDTLNRILTSFKERVQNCLEASCLNDQLEHITEAVQNLIKSMCDVTGRNPQMSSCDDTLNMLIIALSSVSEKMFVGLYVNVRILQDIFPVSFLTGAREYVLICLNVAYEFLFETEICKNVTKGYPRSFQTEQPRDLPENTVTKSSTEGLNFPPSVPKSGRTKPEDKKILVPLEGLVNMI